jgi:hypothetical protein
MHTIWVCHTLQGGAPTYRCPFLYRHPSWYLLCMYAMRYMACELHIDVPLPVRYTLYNIMSAAPCKSHTLCMHGVTSQRVRECRSTSL